jgi:hypothetical protein
VEEPLAVVQELLVETHLLAWIWMVVWRRLWLRPRGSYLTPCLAGALRICLRPSRSALYSWLPNALLVVCLLYGPSPCRLLDSLAITTHAASISDQGIYIYIDFYTLSKNILVSKEDRLYH